MRQRRKNRFPSGAKAHLHGVLSGTAEAVPFQDWLSVGGAAEAVPFQDRLFVGGTAEAVPFQDRFMDGL